MYPMKRFAIILIWVVAALSAMATPPNLAVETIFNENYTDNKNVEYINIQNSNRYYRCLTVKNDNEILKKIRLAIEKDRPMASEYTSFQNKDGSFTQMKFINNKETIKVGLTVEPNGDFFFFIKGPEKAFK